MNITHAVEEEYSGDRLKVIFDRQRELMAKYHDIESRSGLVQTEDCPVNLDDKKGQARIKDFAWRVTEEVGEALDAYEDDDMTHFAEELVDGLHFLTELTILSGWDYDNVVPVIEVTNNKNNDSLDELVKEAERLSDKKGDIRVMEDVTSLVRELGMMCNCLKNKPWKQTNMVTDKNNYYNQLTNVWIVYTSLLLNILDAEGIVQTYLKKSQVNKFRQRSNY